ncbi:MAG: chromosomal replication initiator protein DnaA [Chrysiogenetes bacterium]|nr:chromosomal replication initiator protein DnaA [Chrysiogenetes bacterium]
MENLWERSLPLFQQSMKDSTFDRWVRPIRFGRLEGERMYLQVPSVFFKDYLQEGFLDLFQNKIYESFAERYQIVLEVAADDPARAGNGHNPAQSTAPSRPPQPVPPHRNPSAARERVIGNRLSPRYVFENFVVGKSNDFAHAACRAVADNPHRNDYNPLFIFGGVGLGKTHLVNAIGNRILDQHPNLRIVYVSSENFTNEVVSSIQHHKMEEFKKKYRRDCDILLIDDIQFIAGKETTQEEFFHTFEELHHQGKQIVVTSDKPAREIGGLEERLKSRLDWGLSVDIQPPELETRIAILRRKAETFGFNMGDDVADFLATYCGNNMRELEGSLNRVMAYCELSQRPASLELVQELFQHAVAERNRKPTIENIQKLVAEQFNVKISDIKGPRKHKIVALPRQVAMFLCRKLTGASFPEIGEKFGGRDHSTVIYACEKIDNAMKQDLNLRHRLQTIEQALNHPA